MCVSIFPFFPFFPLKSLRCDGVFLPGSRGIGISVDVNVGVGSSGVEDARGYGKAVRVMECGIIIIIISIPWGFCLGLRNAEEGSPLGTLYTRLQRARLT